MVFQRHADDGRGWREVRRRQTMMAEMSLRVLQVITDPTRRGAQLFAVDLGDALGRRGTRGAYGGARGCSACWSLAQARAGSMSPRWARAASRGRRSPRCDASWPAPTWPSRTGRRRCRPARSPRWRRRFRSSTARSAIRSSGHRRHFDGRAVRVGLSRAAHVVALWEGAATTLELQFGVRADRVTVIPNGVVADRFTPTDAEGRTQARHDLSLDEQRFTLVYAGALGAGEGRRSRDRSRRACACSTTPRRG